MVSRERMATARRQAAPILRREKARPCDDMWHTLKIGLPIAGLLFLLLPFLF